MATLLQIGAALGGLSFLGTIIGALAVWRKSKAEANKAGADAASVLTDSALSIVEDLRVELRSARAEIGALRRHLSVVERLLREQGIPAPEFDWPPHRNGVA